MNCPMTLQNFLAWDAMVKGGMPMDCAFQRAVDWAGMLEERLAQFDPNYQAHQWGLNFKSPVDSDAASQSQERK